MKKCVFAGYSILAYGDWRLYFTLFITDNVGSHYYEIQIRPKILVKF